MRRIVLGAALAAALVAGCGSSTSGSAAPTISPSTAGDPTLVPGAVTQPPVAAGVLELAAANIAFAPTELAAPAGPIVIHFVNKDSGVPHNVEVKDAGGGTVYQGEIATGPSNTMEPIGDLAPGAYTFMCTVHPNMQGTLTVTP